MSRSIKALVLSVSAAIAMFAVLGGLGVHASSTSNDGAYRQLGVYSEVLSRIKSEYVEEPNVPEVTDGALHGLLESLDANSSYLSPAEYKRYKDHHSEGKAGIGATVSKRFGYAAVISVIPGGAGDKAGVNGSDIIEAIENKSTRTMSLAEVNSLLSGPQGSRVTLSVVRARKAEPQKIVVTREVPTFPPVNDKMLEAGIGYVQVDTLTKGKAQEAANKVKNLQKSGAKKLILDLRNCAEGEPAEGIALANLFLDHGTITYLQGQKYPKETFNADPKNQTTKLPLTVLVNRGTANAAEIVAAAILENQRGDVLGDKTFGVGSVQKVIEVPDGSALILSIAKYYSPSGKAIQDSAVTPNILVADADDDAVLDEDEAATPATDEKKPTKQPEDEQLKRAVEALKNRS
jgi:carboxyl-terminal processing protease